MTEERTNSYAREGYVYIIRPIDHNVYKIGCSVNPVARMARLNSKKKYTLEIVCVFHSNDYVQLEFEFHRKYGAYRLCREWFAIPNEEIERLKAASL